MPGHERLAALLALAERHGVTPRTESPNSADEDLAEYTADDGKPVCRWAVVTTAGEFTYVKADADSLAAAAAAAVEFVNDGIYAETPHTIVDLDTGGTYEPEWTTLGWREAGSIDATATEAVAALAPGTSDEARVSWEIDVDETEPVEAARAAWRLMRGTDSIANVFRVAVSGRPTVEVDLHMETIDGEKIA
jgi:hypothetical protein